MYLDGSTSSVLACEFPSRSCGSSYLDGGAGADGCASRRAPSVTAPPETNLTLNATPSITLLSVSKLRLPPAFAHKTPIMQNGIQWK
jgi:hypothetical protein